jgi:propionyl-CoA carboxylase alpha chain
VVTNRDLLVRVLRNPAFIAGEIDTGFLDRHHEVFAPLVSGMDTGKLSCLAAALASAAGRAGRFPAGWRNVPTVPQVVGYDGPSGPVEVGYRFDRYGALAAWSVRRVRREYAGLPSPLPDADLSDHPKVAVVSAAADLVGLDVNGVRIDFAVHQVADVSYVDSPDGLVTLTELPRFPLPEPESSEGSLIAPLPGAIGRVLVVPGQRVVAGDLLLILEAMTLEHPVYAPGAGVVAELPVQAGSQVQTGELLAVITPG